MGRTGIRQAHNNKYQIEVFPASQLGKETDINQGLSLGSVDIIISGSSFAARSFPPIGVTYYPFTFRSPEHLLAYTKSDVYKELTADTRRRPGTSSPPQPITARVTPHRTGPSRTART